jgi:hypothetical protein
VGVGVAVGVAVGVGLGGIVAVAVALGSTVAVGVNVAVAVGVNVAVAVEVGVNVAVAVAVGVGPPRANCIVEISLSVKAVFQIAACCTLPLAYGLTEFSKLCIKEVRLHALARASVALVEATLKPSTHKVNAVPLRLNVIECQFPSNAVPPAKGPLMVALFPRAIADAEVVVPLSPICARSLVVAEFEIASAPAELKLVPPLKRAKRVKFVLSRLGITASFLLA